MVQIYSALDSFTRSLDFPTTEPALPGVLNAFSSHAFVAKFDTTEVGEASLVYSKRLGGTATDVGNAIALDSGGNTYVTGRAGPKFPTTVGAFQTGFKLGGGDAFVAKIDITGNALIYSTFLGGMGLDEGFGITVDSFGNAYVVGQTSSADFPTAGPLGPFQALSGGNADAFVTKVDPLGSALVYSTYLGGSGFDVGRDIAIDQALRQAHVTGLTRSSDFPTLNAFQPSYGGGSGDAFVTRVGFSGSPMVYPTYLGGNSTEDGSGIAVIDRCSAYLTGFTLSPNFPTVNPLQGGLGGSADAFVGKLIWGDQPPSFLFLELSRDSIAANNHKLFEVNATIEVFDDCPDLSVELVSIVSNEPDEGLGDGDTPNDIQGADFGTDDRSFFLRAERSGTGDGRVYTVTYRAIDAGGQVAKRSATVTVTHDQSGH